MTENGADVRCVRVLVVDDDPLVRTGLRLMLGGERDLEVVGEASDGDEVPAAVADHHPDVVLMDVRMPRLDGVEATRRLLAAAAVTTAVGPGVGAVDAPEGAGGGAPVGGAGAVSAGTPAVVMLTTFDADETVLEALRAGAAGYLLKHADPASLVAAVHRAASGEAVFSPDVLHTLVSHARSGEPTSTDPEFAALSERERRIAEHVARGLSNAEIASTLYLSPGTVKAEISAVLARLGLENRIQLAIRAHEQRER